MQYRLAQLANFLISMDITELESGKKLFQKNSRLDEESSKSIPIFVTKESHMGMGFL